MLNAVIIGGTSGVGLELAKLLQKTHTVEITGRIDPEIEGLTFRFLELGEWVIITDLEDEIFKQVVDHPRKIDLLIYAAGFCQEGRVREFNYIAINDMMNVGLIAPALLLGLLMRHQPKLPGFIAITSTSQWNPRLNEPLYTAVKAGLGMLANSFALDPDVGKVLVVGPSGVKTPFWRDSPRDTSGMLDPSWVAATILETYDADFKYRFAKILRDPPRVEIAEERK